MPKAQFPDICNNRTFRTRRQWSRPLTISVGGALYAESMNKVVEMQNARIAAMGRKAARTLTEGDTFTLSQHGDVTFEFVSWFYPNAHPSGFCTVLADGVERKLHLNMAGSVKMVK